MRKIYDVVCDYSGKEAHSGIEKNQPGLIDVDFQTLIELYINRMNMQLRETGLKRGEIYEGCALSIDGCLMGISHKERVRKYTYAIQRLCEVQGFSNLALDVIADKTYKIQSIRWLTGVFFNLENLSGLTGVVREVLMIDPSLDHIIKPVFTENLHGFFCRNEISLDDLCVHVYENQDVVDTTFFIKRFQTNSKI